MSEVNNHLFETIDRQNSHESAHAERPGRQHDRDQLVASPAIAGPASTVRRWWINSASAPFTKQ